MEVIKMDSKEYKMVKVTFCEFNNGKRHTLTKKGLLIDEGKSFIRLKTKFRYVSLNRDYIISISELPNEKYKGDIDDDSID